MASVSLAVSNCGGTATATVTLSSDERYDSNVQQPVKLKVTCGSTVHGPWDMQKVSSNPDKWEKDLSSHSFSGNCEFRTTVYYVAEDTVEDWKDKTC